MTLDPQAQMVLNLMPDDTLAVDRLSPDVLRENMTTGSAASPRVPCGEITELVVPTRDGTEITARQYRPVGGATNPGGVVFFHGGGWVLGNLETHDNQARSLCEESGMTLISIDYRLAPEHPYPTGLEDCYDSLCWVADQAETLDVDADKLCVAGDSAGGNLAAAVSLMARDLEGPSLALQLLIYPCTDMDTERWASFSANAEGYMLTRAMMEWFYDQYIESDRRAEPYAAPIRAEDLSGLPPAVVAVAGYDPLHDEGVAYARALQEAGVPTTLLSYPGLIHGFAGMGLAVAKAREAVALMGAALATATS